MEWYTDDETCTQVWDRFAKGPAPVGYDPYIIPQWSAGPTSDQFAALRLTPYRLRVMPGTVMTAGSGEVLNWRTSNARQFLSLIDIAHAPADHYSAQFIHGDREIENANRVLVSASQNNG